MMLVPLDTLADQNALRAWPAQDKLIFVFLLGLLSYFLIWWCQILLIFWVSWWILVYARIPWHFYRQLLLLPLGFIGMSLPALLVTIQFTPTTGNQTWLWSSHWGGIYAYVFQDNLYYGREIVLRAIAITICVYFLLLTTPFVELLQVLKRMKCPSLILELLGLMYRFIFILLATLDELLTAQRARLGYRNRRTTWNSLKIIGGELLKKSLINYRQIHLGLISRGFTGQFQFLDCQSYSCPRRYRIEAIAGYFSLLGLGIYGHGFTI